MHANDTMDDAAEHTEGWYKKYWRPMLAAVYAVIVVFDFLVMPIILEINNTKYTAQQAVELSLQYTDASAQTSALSIFTNTRTWNPLTLMGGGMFHLAFGALLTGAAVTRGMEKKQHAENGKMLT